MRQYQNSLTFSLSVDTLHVFKLPFFYPPQALVVAYSQDIEGEGEQERVTNSEAAGILRQCRKKHSDLATLQEASESLEARAAQSRRETEELEKNLIDDSGLLKELLDHLAEAERDNLLLLQYSAEDASKLKVMSCLRSSIHLVIH